MYVFHYFIPFVSGLVIGSFLNCVIYRLEKEESFLKGRSYCPNCKHILNWQDLIPVVSFLWLKGQCRYCQKPISWQYPMVELATGLMFLLIFLASRDLAQPDNFLLFNTVYLWVLTSLLIVIFVYDLRHYIIPDSIVYPGIIIAVLYRLFGIWNFGNWDICLLAQFWCGGEFWVYDLGFSILPAFVLLAIILFSGGRWMGMGDLGLAKHSFRFIFSFFSGCYNWLRIDSDQEKRTEIRNSLRPLFNNRHFFGSFLGAKRH